MTLDNKRLTTSKKILYMSYAFLFVMTGIFVYLLFVGSEYVGEMGIVVMGALAEVGVHTAVYSSKSKKENQLYIAYDMIDKLAEKYGVDSVIALYDSVVRD